MSAAAPGLADVIWHEVECGGYGADLALWEELAAGAGGTVLDLGCGSGRVTLQLARRGAPAHGIDVSPPLVEALRERAEAEGLPVTTTVGDVRAHALDREAHRLALAPMQLMQLLDGSVGRVAALSRVAAGLAPGGLLACAIVEDTDQVVGDAGPETVPDVREDRGWIYSSLPTAVVRTGERVEIHRLRQTVSPDGDLTDEPHVDRLDVLDAATLEREAVAAGLVPAGRRSISQSELHVGSTVVVFAKEA